MTIECPLCGAATNQPICSKCWKKYTADLRSLYQMLPQVERIGKREERIGGRQQGHAASPFASTPVELGAMDLLQEAESVIEDVAANCNIWAGAWRVTIKRMIARRTQVTQSRHLLRDRERIAALEQKVRLRLTPPEERIIIGACLTKECDTALSIVKGQDHVACPKCSALWSVKEIREARRLKFEHVTMIMTPAEAAGWIKKETGLFVTRKVVNMWAQRDMISAPSVGDGGHAYKLNELISLAENMRRTPTR